MISGESGHRPIVVSDQVSDPRTLEIFILLKVTKGRKLVSPMKGGIGENLTIFPIFAACENNQKSRDGL